MGRPILFSAPMVRAILDGSKTQTRRTRALEMFNAAPDEWSVIRPLQKAEPMLDGRVADFPGADARSWLALKNPAGIANMAYQPILCPFGAVGDRLWVRETWQHYDWTEEGEPYVRYAADNAVRFCGGAGEGETLVDVWAQLSEPSNYAIDNRAADRKWRPSRFMPRWASRITLTITDVRVERVQDISEEDCEAEGVVPRHMYGGDIDEKDRDSCNQGFDMFLWRESYAELWDSLNAKRAPWESNPFCWVLTFDRVTP